MFSRLGLHNWMSLSLLDILVECILLIELWLRIGDNSRPGMSFAKTGAQVYRSR